MRKSTTVLIVILVIIIGAGAWYWWMSMSSNKNVNQIQPAGNLGLNGSPNQTNTGTPVVAALTIAHSATLGDYLVAANGMTLYRFTNDKQSVSNCSGQCAAIWPPYAPVDQNPLMPGAGVTGTIGTIFRTDGVTQITYNGVPLYFWQGDVKTGDTTGQNYNGVWFVVKP